MEVALAGIALDLNIRSEFFTDRRPVKFQHLAVKRLDGLMRRREAHIEDVVESFHEKVVPSVDLEFGLVVACFHRFYSSSKKGSR